MFLMGGLFLHLESNIRYRLSHSRIRALLPFLTVPAVMNYSQIPAPCPVDALPILSSLLIFNPNTKP